MIILICMQHDRSHEDDMQRNHGCVINGISVKCQMAYPRMVWTVTSAIAASWAAQSIHASICARKGLYGSKGCGYKGVSSAR